MAYGYPGFIDLKKGFVSLVGRKAVVGVELILLRKADFVLARSCIANVGDSVIREKEIKAALIDWLYARGMVRDAVVINEMVVANWARRADLALANGRLYGFEIKSEFDSLKRLPGQIESFRRHFDKVTVVAASKFVPEIVRSYPVEVGVLEVYLKSGRVMFRQIRPGRIEEVKEQQVIASLITRAEIERLLRLESIKYENGSSRKALLQYVDLVSVKKLKAFALGCIKERYRDTFEAFDMARGRDGSFDNLSLLSKAESHRVALQSVEDMPRSYFKDVVSENVRPVNISFLEEEFGALLDGVPQTVLVRKKRQIRSS
ncbi:sce7726 family protein [Pseudomonas chlororaphis]|uniref:sce7726 family protein n=1 Tax=Pseudomonas chlororaphis TaxID=587753 RepID=UPI003C13D886